MRGLVVVYYDNMDISLCEVAPERMALLVCSK